MGFDNAMEGIENLVTDEMHKELDVEPNGDEIRDSLFHMHPNKAPRSDRMHIFCFPEILGYSWAGCYSAC